eukprot:1227400-Prymnesium_polylepis.3
MQLGGRVGVDVRIVLLQAADALELSHRSVILGGEVHAYALHHDDRGLLAVGDRRGIVVLGNGVEQALARGHRHVVGIRFFHET